MSEVIRYRQCKDTGEPIQEMMIHAQGEWVEYDTVADLQRQLAEKEQMLQTSEEVNEVMGKENKRLRDALAYIATDCDGKNATKDYLVRFARESLLAKEVRGE